ncbi:NACHT domain protein [Ilyonectria robusta]
MSTSDPAQAAFNKAIREFKKGLKDQALYSQILTTTSIDQVYDLTDQLQKVQGRGDHLRNLARIQPYLERMRAYTGAIDTFVQAKPDILALIWGPIRLLIQWTSTLTGSLNALVRTTEEIGNLLSEFDHTAKLFSNKQHINEVLALLFQDILDFYLVSLKFFRMAKLKSMFEAFWPKKKEEIELVIGRIKDHTYHLRNEVRLEVIQEAYDARQLEIENFAKLEEADRMQEYAAVETAIAPTFYGKKLNFLRGRVCEGTGDWLAKDPDLSKWLQATKDSSKIIWLCGIPGAGKTYLAASIVNASILLGRTLFVFLSYEHKDTSAMSVIHSLIFQLARKDPNLQDMVRYSNRDPLEFDLTSAVNLLTNLIHGAGPVRIVIDGLDEIEQAERVRLLRQMLKVSSDCDEARVLICSRPEADITALLEKTSKPIRIDTQNTPIIHAFAMGRYHDWLQDHFLSPEDSTEIGGLISALAGQAKGMFLYAHLILKGLDFLHSVSEIRRDLKVLPTDLNAAYGRIFTRINENLPNEAAREKARKVLGWIGHSPVSLTIRELEQALIINIGDLDQDPTGLSTLSLVRLCGPVVEEVDGELHLVHFTAKDPMIKNSLDPAQCILSLAKCCITYLSQHHHDGNIDDDLFQDNVIRGVYRLHHFASDNWSRLVESYLQLAPVTKDSTELTQLIAILDLFAARGSENYLQSEKRTDHLALEALRTEMSNDAYELVCNELEFHREASTRLFELGKGEQRSVPDL